MSDNRQQPKLHIGWSLQSITPNKPVQLHGQHYERVSEGVRDEVAATALALETKDGDRSTEQAIIVSCDLVAVPKWVVEALRGKLKPRLADFDPHKLIITATHTHTAPTIDEDLYPAPGPGVILPSDYAEFLIERLADAAAEAWQARKPGVVSWALAHAAVGFNRRIVYADGTARMYGSSDTSEFMSVEGSEDHGVDILFTRDADGRLTGAVVNLACPSQVVEDKNFISADFWGDVRRRIGSKHPGVFVLPLCAAAGDQSPRDLVRRGRGEADFSDESGLEEMGRRISCALEQALGDVGSEGTAAVVFTHVVEDLALPARKISEQELEETRAFYVELAAKDPADNSVEGGRLRKAKSVLERHENLDDDPHFVIELHVIRLGDIALATNPFELFLDYGQRMKARSPAVQTFVVQLAGDRGMYLPTAKALSGGHYGTMLSECFVGAEGGQVLVDRTVEIIEDLFQR